MATKCIFCNIAAKEAPADIVYEDDAVVVFRDINPKAATHLLLIPRQHIESIAHLTPEQDTIVGNLILTAQRMATDHDIADSGYKLLFNVGRGGGQIVDHIHLHLLSGEKIEMP